MVFFWPDYRHRNPYQTLLYQAASDRFDIRPGDIDAAIAALTGPRASGGPEGVVFHLHWLATKGLSEAEARARFDLFLTRIDAFRAAGGRFIWTLHNVIGHEAAFPVMEAEISARIAARADVIHLHAAESIPEVTAVYPLPADRIGISRHGNFTGLYPDDGLTRSEARHALGLDPEDDVILSLGMIRVYKGMDLLIRTTRDLLAGRPRLRLCLAGLGVVDPLAGVEPELTPQEAARIRIDKGFVDPADVQTHLRAADVVVLPYRSMLTSGSLLLALGFGVPVVIPAFGMVREVLDGQDAGITYPPDSGQAGLTRAVADILRCKDEGRLPAMARNARARAMALDWPDFGPILRRALA